MKRGISLGDFFIDPKADQAGLLAHLADLASLGIDHAVVSPGSPWDERALDWLTALTDDIHAIPVGPPAPLDR